MDNTFTLQPDETNGSTDLQDSAVTESGNTGTAVENDTPLQRMDAVTEVNREPELPEEEEAMERPYKLRPLKDSDLFPMLKILRKVGIGEFKSVFSHFIEEREDNKKSKKEIGMAAVVEAVEILVSNIPNAETEIYNFWSDLSGIKVDILKEMEFGTLPMMIMETFINARGTSFFKVLSKFF